MSIQNYCRDSKDDKDPTLLRGLSQAVFVSQCLCNRDSEEAIVTKFKGDRQLVKMWVSFLRHSRWLDYDMFSQKWTLTEKGRERMVEQSK